MEYFAHPQPRLTSAQIDAVLSKLRDCDAYTIRRHSSASVDLDFAGIESSSWEMVTLKMQPKEVYIAFHAGHRSHREGLMGWLTSELLELGVRIEFEEE